MIEDLKPYPEYTDSGLPWLGKVPAHWRVLRAKTMFREVDERSTTGREELLSVSHITGVTPRSQKNVTMFLAKSNVGHKICRPDDVAINTMWAWMGALGVSRHTGLVSPAYGVYRPLGNGLIQPRFADYILRTGTYAAEYQRRSTGVNSSRMRLYPEHFLRVPIVVPPPAEQAAIVRFLGWATGQVDRAILAKRKVIALLNEQKQVVIDRAVTGAQNKNPARLPVNSPFLDSVPSHWEWVRFKNRIGFQEGPGIMLADFREDGVPLLRISCLSGPEATLDGCNFLSPSKVREKWSHFAIREGDYLLSASGSTGAVKKASDAVLGAIPYTGIIRLWAKTLSTNMEYIKYFMMSGPFKAQISMAKAGVGIEHFGPTHLKTMWICHPPLEEQKRIAKEIETATRDMNLSISRFDRQIELLREYRNRLIEDAVQGRCDVRKVAAILPETVSVGEAQIGEDEQDLSGELDEAAA
jgi:type I restriction enzyme S subunit